MDFANHLRVTRVSPGGDNRDDAGAVVTLTVDRPARKNALTRATLAAIAEAAHALASDKRVRAVILAASRTDPFANTSNGEPGTRATFLAGADIDESLQIRSREDARAFAKLGFEARAALCALPVPVVAAMTGDTFGGGLELALAADVRILAARARVAFVHARMGLTTSWGTAARLPVLVGPEFARKLLFSGAIFSAEAAKDGGLVSALADDPEAAALEFATQVCAGDRDAIAAQKRLFQTPENAAVDAAERDAFVESWCAPPHWEAVARFLAARREDGTHTRPTAV